MSAWRRDAYGRSIALVVLVAVGLAGCGGKKANNAASGTTTSTTSEATSTSVVTGETTATTAAGAAATSTTAKATSGTTTKTTSKTTKATSVLTKSTAPAITVAGLAQTGATTTKVTTEPPQAGGTLTVLLASEGAGLDPTVGTGSIGGTDPQRLFAVYDALLYQDPSNGGIVPQTAESMTTSDGKSWTLKIRPNIKFTDGTTYDAAAVKYNWDRCTNPPDPQALPCTNKSITSSFQTTVADPLTLNIVLTAVNGQFPRTLSAGQALSYIGSPTAEKATTQADFNIHPVGAGPFTLKQWVRDSQQVFVRNPSYWNAPRPYVDSVVFKPITDEGQRTNSFKAGEAQLEFNPSLDNANALSSNFQNLTILGINSLINMFNFTHLPFSDTNAWKAIQLAIDTDQFNKTFYAGQPTPLGYFPPNFPYSDPSIQFPKPDLTKAQQMVDAYVAAHGQDLTFKYNTGDTTLAGQQASMIQQQVQRLNHVKMTINQESTRQIVSDLIASNYDMSALSYTGVDPEPQFFADVITKGTRNFSGYSSSLVDKDIADSRAAIDANTRIAALKQLQRDLMNDMPFVLLNLSPNIWLEQPNVRDFAPFDEGGPLLDRVWLKSH